MCVKIESRGTNEENQLISGTYIHPKLIAHVGIWISPEFGLKISDVVNRYFIEWFKQQIKEYESVVADKNNVITSLENSNKELDSTNKHQNQSIN